MNIRDKKSILSILVLQSENTYNPDSFFFQSYPGIIESVIFNPSIPKFDKFNDPFIKAKTILYYFQNISTCHKFKSIYLSKILLLLDFENYP